MECGYYEFEDAETKERFGSFEIFEIETDNANGEREAGFYWWCQYPGQQATSAPQGPFGDPSEAYEDAMNYGYR